MCGIAGVVSGDIRAVTAPALDRAAEAISYRGQDGHARWSDGVRVHLLHSRLSIVDPERGSQPMTDESGRFTIVFNGEVHNLSELRRRLERRGTTFRTRSDTEVVLEGYRSVGPDICRDLVGMYAFAIVDQMDGSVFLARDRLGEKPLYWYSGADGLWFASSAEAFTRAAGWTGRLSPRGLTEYFAAGAVRSPSTIYEQVSALEPGCYAVVRPGDRSVRGVPYWALRLGEVDPAPDATQIDEFEATLAASVGLRLQADVPVAVSLSGGVDSGLIAALAATHHGERLPCFTLDRHVAGDESEDVRRARQLADRLDLPWTHFDYDYGESYLDDLVSAYQWFDQPCAQPVIGQVSLLSRQVKPVAGVLLGGGGADEILHGYEGDERLRLLDMATRATGAVGRSLGRSRLDPLSLLANRLRSSAEGSPVGGTEAAAMIADYRALVRKSGAATALDVKLHYSLTWGHVDAHTRMGDIAGLAAGVEMRSPFLDHRVVERAAALPARLKVRRPWSRTTNKWVGRVIFQRNGGGDLAWAPKLNLGANIRWEAMLARSAVLADAVVAAFDAVAGVGLDMGPTRSAWSRYVADVERGLPPSTYTPVVRALMLGLWLQRAPAPVRA